MDVIDNAAAIKVYLPGEEPTRINLKLIAGLLGMGVVGLVMIKAT